MKAKFKTPKSPEGDFAHSQTKSPSGDLGVLNLAYKFEYFACMDLINL